MLNVRRLKYPKLIRCFRINELSLHKFGMVLRIKVLILATAAAACGNKAENAAAGNEDTETVTDTEIGMN